MCVSYPSLFNWFNSPFYSSTDSVGFTSNACLFISSSEIVQDSMLLTCWKIWVNPHKSALPEKLGVHSGSSLTHRKQLRQNLLTKEHPCVHRPLLSSPQITAPSDRDPLCPSTSAQAAQREPGHGVWLPGFKAWQPLHRAHAKHGTLRVWFPCLQAMVTVVGLPGRWKEDSQAACHTRLYNRATEPMLTGSLSAKSGYRSHLIWVRAPWYLISAPHETFVNYQRDLVTSWS